MDKEERKRIIQKEYEKSKEVPSHARLARQLGVSRGTVYRDVKELGLPFRQKAANGYGDIRRGKVRDYSQGIIKINGDAFVSADYHLPFHNADLVEKLLTLADHSIFGKIPLHIIGGDLLDQYVFSFWDHRDQHLQWTDELEIASQVCKRLFAAFDKTVILPGNHTDRLLRLTGFQMTFQNVMDMLRVPLDNVVLSEHNYCVLNGKWRITHPTSYRKTRLSVANELAKKHQQNIIMQHGHEFSLGVDDGGHYIIADGGGMFDEVYFDYRMLSDSTYSIWEPGFFVIYHDKPYLFNNRFTEWNFWNHD